VPVGAFQRVDEHLRTRQYLDLVGVEDKIVRPQRIPNISFGGGVLPKVNCLKRLE
jgi:hypothetical protein